MVDSGLVTLMLGQVSSFVQNLLRLECVAGHFLDHPVHDVSQQVPNLSASRARLRARNLKLLRFRNILQFLP